MLLVKINDNRIFRSDNGYSWYGDKSNPQKNLRNV